MTSEIPVGPKSMLELIVSLLIAAGLGHLAQSTGLCMVRGMKEWMGGRPGFMIAILCSGVFAWVAGVLAEPMGFGLPFQRFGVSWWFALGGLLFGLGTAFNQGCGVSTLSKLSRGELEMIATMSGWLLGWYALERWGPQPANLEMNPPDLLVFMILAGVSLLLSVWLIRSHPARRNIWFGMMGIGLLAGFLFLYERAWTPSGLLHDLSVSLRGEESAAWPDFDRYLIILSLLGGMLLTALWTMRFQVRRPGGEARPRSSAGWHPDGCRSGTGKRRERLSVIADRARLLSSRARCRRVDASRFMGGHQHSSKSGLAFS